MALKSHVEYLRDRLEPEGILLQGEAERLFSPKESEHLMQLVDALSSEGWDRLLRDDLSVLETLLSVVQTSCLHRNKSSLPKMWGQRLADMLSHDSVADLIYDDDQVAHSVAARIFALQGDFPRAMRQLKRITDRTSSPYWDAVVTMVYSSIHHSGLIDALEFLFVDDCFPEAPPSSYANIANAIAHHPHFFSLPDRIAQWNTNDATQASSFLLHIAAHHTHIAAALRVVDQVKERSLHVSQSAIRKVLNVLMRRRIYTRAVDVLSLVEDKTTEEYWRNKLVVSSHLGDVEGAESSYKELEKLGRIDQRALTSLMTGYANAMRPDDVLRIFEEHFPKVDGRRQNHKGVRLDHIYYSVVTSALARSRRGSQVEDWWQDMKENNIGPEWTVFPNVVLAYAYAGDVPGVFKTLERRKGYPPDILRRAYTTAIDAVGRQRNHEAVDAIIQRAIEEDGVKPDAVMVLAMMNAWAESGKWDSVIRLMDSLRSKKDEVVLQAHNIYLKALVAIGAPFKAVRNHYDRIKASGLEPDEYTYAMVLKSAISSGTLRAALHLLQHLIENHPKQPHILHVSHFTMVAEELLRRGDRHHAERLVVKMLSLGIQPTAITQRMAINSSFEVPPHLHSVDNFSTSKGNLSPAGKGRTLSITNVYLPLLRRAARNNQNVRIFRLYELYKAAGGPDTVSVLTPLLHTCVERGNHELFFQLWTKLLAIAKTQSIRVNADGQTEVFDTVQGLNNPLSLFIEMATRLGHHELIPKQWKELLELGMRFDLHNWNQLARALIRGGSPGSAFEVAERIILPYRRLSLIPTEFHEEGESGPLLLRPTDSNLPQDPLAPILRAPVNTSRRRRRLTTHLSKILSQSRRFPMTSLLDSSNGPTTALGLLQRLRTRWSIWRLHRTTSDLFLKTLIYLRHGMVPRATTAEEPELEFIPDQEKAKGILNFLREKCPELYTSLERRRRRLKLKMGRRYARAFGMG